MAYHNLICFDLLNPYKMTTPQNRSTMRIVFIEEMSDIFMNF